MSNEDLYKDDLAGYSMCLSMYYRDHSHLSPMSPKSSLKGISYIQHSRDELMTPKGDIPSNLYDINEPSQVSQLGGVDSMD